MADCFLYNVLIQGEEEKKRKDCISSSSSSSTSAELQLETPTVSSVESIYDPNIALSVRSIMPEEKPITGLHAQPQSQPQPPNANTQTEQPSKATSSRFIKLISIRLKEAAMDSPSFRASFNWYNNNIDQTDQWIDGLLKFIKKYPQQYNDFKDFNDVFLKQLIPDFINNGLLDQDDTQNILDTTKTNLNHIWEESLALLEFKEQETVNLLNNLSKTFVKPYKEIKKTFEFMQGRYDQVLSKYLSQTKTKEPSAIREDAFQLFEVRKSYLSASLDMCLEISRFHHTFDTTLVQLAECITKGKKLYDDKYFSKVKAWNAATTKSVESLLEDLRCSRDQIEQVTLSQIEPSRDLRLHNPALINPTTLSRYNPKIDGEVEREFEKHGWLFMKTTVGKPARQIWVRRWAFVKSGIFGLLLLAPSKNFVQETDKIGVLLCNIRYAPDEERRFCFEIKTIDSTIVFQAESLKELRAWIRIFTSEKKCAISNAQNDNGKYAFGRYPPLLYEFASTSITSADVELTSSKVENSNADETITTFTTSHLANLVTQTGHEIKYDMSNNPHIPINTERSKLALKSHEFLDLTVVPTAVTANIWGSVNWGLYYMEDRAINGFTKGDPSLKNNGNISQLNQTGIYPSYYPAHLRVHDIQLKALFDNSISKDEFVLIQFTCLWALNPEQELSGSCYATGKNVYFHLNSAGFVSLLKKPLSDIVAIDATSEKDWDTLKIYDFEGLNMKGRLFLEDSRLIRQSLDLLINDISKENPSTNEQILKMLHDLKSEDDQRKEIQKAAVGSPAPGINQRLELNSVQPFKGVTIKNKSFRINYCNEYNFLETKSFNIPAKALFHIMFGDNSHILHDSVPFADVDDFRASPWYQNGETLTKYIDFKINMFNNVINLRGSDGDINFFASQTVEEMIENKYYRIHEKRNPMKLPSSDVFKVETKMVIIEQDARSSKLLIYFRTRPTHVNSSFWISRLVERTITRYKKENVETILKKLEDAANQLGQHGKIIKAIRIYGNLGKSEEPFKKREDVVFVLKYYIAFKYYSKILFFNFAKLILRCFKFFFFELLQLIYSLSLNKMLLGALALSVLLNLFLSSRATVSFWYATRTERNLGKIKETLNLNRMERAIKLDEFDLLMSNSFNFSSRVFENFLASKANGKSNLSEDSRFGKIRNQLSVKRNQLLVQLKILEKIEKELVAGNYKYFLLSELHHCQVAISDIKVNDPDLVKYCQDCAEELENLSNLL